MRDGRPPHRLQASGVGLQRRWSVFPRSSACYHSSSEAQTVLHGVKGAVIDSRTSRLLVATTNLGKLDEIRDILGGLPLTIVTLADRPAVPEPEETGLTFAENARLKARYYAGVTAELTVAEDSGLEIDALDGEPGVHSARFNGESYAEKFATI